MAGRTLGLRRKLNPTAREREKKAGDFISDTVRGRSPVQRRTRKTIRRVARKVESRAAKLRRLRRNRLARLRRR